MKKVLLAIVGMILLASASCAFAADNFGIINPDAVFASYPKFRNAQKEIAAFAQKKDAEIAPKLKDEKDADKRGKIVAAARAELAKHEQKLMSPVFDNVRNAIAKVAKAKNLTAVHNMGMVYYGGVDITKDVIEELKKR